MTRAALTVWLLALAVLSNGCWFRGGRKPPPPPPKKTTKKAPTGSAHKRSQGSQTSSGAHRAAQPALKNEPAEPAKPQTRAPVLGEMMSEDEKSEYRREYEVNTAAANRVLASLSSRQLTREQSDTAARIRSFLQQAATARENDWPLAANLARRAALLARDLAGRVQ